LDNDSQEENKKINDEILIEVLHEYLIESRKKNNQYVRFSQLLDYIKKRIRAKPKTHQENINFLMESRKYLYNNISNNRTKI